VRTLPQVLPDYFGHQNKQAYLALFWNMMYSTECCGPAEIDRVQFDWLVCCWGWFSAPGLFYLSWEFRSASISVAFDLPLRKLYQSSPYLRNNIFKQCSPLDRLLGCLSGVDCACKRCDARKWAWNPVAPSLSSLCSVTDGLCSIWLLRIANQAFNLLLARV